MSAQHKRPGTVALKARQVRAVLHANPPLAHTGQDVGLPLIAGSLFVIAGVLAVGISRVRSKR